jgi:hypothetical protein
MYYLAAPIAEREGLIERAIDDYEKAECSTWRNLDGG